MNRFTAEAVDHHLWPKLCYRGRSTISPPEKEVDGVQCTESAYQNLTSKLEVGYKQVKKYYKMMSHFHDINKWFDLPNPNGHKDEIMQQMVNISANDPIVYRQVHTGLSKNFTS